MRLQAGELLGPEARRTPMIRMSRDWWAVIVAAAAAAFVKLGLVPRIPW
jgi:hypothetical protein